jgi:hypothetical protein
MNLKDETVLILATNASAQFPLQKFLSEMWDTICESCGPKLQVVMSDSYFENTKHLRHEVNKMSTDDILTMTANHGNGGTDINGVLSIVGQMTRYNNTKTVICVYAGNDTFYKEVVDANWRKFENLIIVVTDPTILSAVTTVNQDALPYMYNNRIFDPYTFQILLFSNSCQKDLV